MYILDRETLNTFLPYIWQKGLQFLNLSPLFVMQCLAGTPNIKTQKMNRINEHHYKYTHHFSEFARALKFLS